MKKITPIVLILFSTSLLSDECPVTPTRDCLDPIESVRSEPGCYCFSCGSNDGKPWMLCTTDSELASLVEDRAGLGLAVEANEMESESPGFPTMFPEFEGGPDGTPVSGDLILPGNERLRSELKALGKEVESEGGRSDKSSGSDGEGE